MISDNLETHGTPNCSWVINAIDLVKLGTILDKTAKDVAALANEGWVIFNIRQTKDIKIIIDGYGLFPFYKDDLLFIPQLFYREIFLPFGIQSTQLHINYWDDKDFERFENFIVKHHNKIVDLDYIIDITNPNSIQNITNFIVEKTLKTARLFK